MKFKHGTRRRAAEYEKDWVQRWKDDQTFEKSVTQRPADNAYVFYDGPPFITGVPHHGTLLSSIVKDAVPRYWTMKGKRVERRWGWDCHGLPAENFVEKQLNITDRRQIVTSDDQPAPLDKDGHPLPTISLEKYINKARESMVANSETWQGVIDRIGRWVDFKGAYRTMDKDFMESVWWAFKQLYEAGKIYEGEKVLMYDTKFATPVSKAEVTMDNDAYQTVTDPSVYVKFNLMDEDAAVLAWTTTPWTLPANLMLAVNSEMMYCEVLVGGEKLIIAEEALERTLQDEKHQLLDYDVLRTFSGSELVGKNYQPLDTGSAWPENDKIHTIYAADFVSHESGTGIVHIAPAYGEDDFELAQRNNIPVIHVIDDNGYYVDSSYKGLEVWQNNKFIAKDLKEKGVVWKIEYIRHEYPFNPRSKQRIMYRAIPSWFFAIQGQKPLMLEQNENINWFPHHLKHGRFAKNIEQAPDWNLSRDRFWATAMPVWKGDQGTVKVVGSYAELKELSGVELEDYHRPWVDKITFEIDGEKFTRIDKVLDCWFESGSMPFAQLHYPFENRQKFEANYPADFIVEYIGQVRAWFYYVHAVNTALAEIGAFGPDCQHKNAYSNVITTGVVAGNDGRKMSKSLGNFTDPNELMDKFSADSLRFLLLSSPLLNGEDFALHDKDVGDVARKLAMIWNMYDFFTMYAEVDGWEFDGELIDPLSGQAISGDEGFAFPAKRGQERKLDQLAAERPEEKSASEVGTNRPLRSVTYDLNLIDTPGHVDFSYEVSRSLQACEGAVLVVDASQGIQAQTLANVYLAMEQDLTIIPVLNKVDLPAADVPRVSKQVINLLGCDESEIIHISAKTGQNVDQVLEAIVERIPAPIGQPHYPTRALIFDSYYDDYRGVILYVRLVDGQIKKGEEIRMLATEANGIALEVGHLSPTMQPDPLLDTGEIGYIVTNLKTTREARVGDTVTLKKYIG